MKKSARETLGKIRPSPGRGTPGGRFSFLLLFVCLLPAPSPASGAGLQSEAWLLIDTGKLTLTVMRGEHAQMTLHNIAIGRFGASREKRRGDNTTPLGRFRVTRIERDSGFHRFIRLDYPGAEHAQLAYEEGVISGRELQAIRDAHRRGKSPPQNTALGGNIGIHGLGQGDAGLHQTMNWTRGCVALTDQQVDSLLPWTRIGTTVEIR